MPADAVIRCPHCGVEFKEQDVAGLRLCPVCETPLPHAGAQSVPAPARRGPIRGLFTAVTFVDPQTSRTERIALAWLWTLLFGPVYFAYKGAWFHAVASLVAAVVTLGLSWIIYPLFAAHLLRNHYLRQGLDPL